MIKRTDINIDMYCPFNIFHLLKNMLPVADSRLRWHDAHEDYAVRDANPNDMRLVITPKMWQIDYDDQTYTYNLDDNSIFSIFGRDNLELLINHLMNEVSFANIYYTRMMDIPELKESHTRFFHIIEFSDEQL
jgi:hypothetical protein